MSEKGCHEETESILFATFYAIFSKLLINKK